MRTLVKSLERRASLLDHSVRPLPCYDVLSAISDVDWGMLTARSNSIALESLGIISLLELAGKDLKQVSLESNLAYLIRIAYRCIPCSVPAGTRQKRANGALRAHQF